MLPPYAAIAVGLVGVAAFVLRQVALQRRDDALLDVRIFRFRSFVLPLVVMVFVAMNGFGVMIVLPLFLASALGLSTLALGLFLVPGGAMISLVSALGGKIYDRVGPRPLAIPGAIVWTSCLWFLSTVDHDTSVWTVLAAYLVWTGSQALMWAPMTTAALAGLPANLYAHGTAAFSTVQQLAGAAGGAILISAYTIGANATDAGNLTLAQTVSATQTAFTTAGIIAIGAVVGALFVGRARETTEETPLEGGSATPGVAADALSAR
jgi:DHA2 family lincomycin resistance protein-like MFS transporter